MSDMRHSDFKKGEGMWVVSVYDIEKRGNIYLMEALFSIAASQHRKCVHTHT